MSISQNGENTDVMASFTQTSIGPNSSSTEAAAARTAAMSATSTGRARCGTPIVARSSLTPRSPSRPRASAATLQPRSAN
jgi:hypothetical protein